MSSTTGKQLSKLMGTEVVSLYVGRKRKEFVVHKNLICIIEYFAKAFNQDFGEAFTGVMYILEDNLGVLAIVVDFLYECRSEIPYELTQKHFIKLICFCVFAGKICWNEGFNCTIDVLRIVTEGNGDNAFTVEVAEYIYANIFNGSPLRKVCIERFSSALYDDLDESYIPPEDELLNFLDCSKEIVFDFFRDMRGRWGYRNREADYIPKDKKLSDILDGPKDSILEFWVDIKESAAREFEEDYSEEEDELYSQGRWRWVYQCCEYHRHWGDEVCHQKGTLDGLGIKRKSNMNDNRGLLEETLVSFVLEWIYFGTSNVGI